MDLGNGLGHLTYSTLVHPADDWAQLWDSLQKYLPPVKRRISPNQPFGVCIRLSAPTAAELSTDKAKRDTLKAFLKDQDLYVYTANAFVYGVFKNTRIKEQVYEPDWRTNERRDYTKQVADILADICPGEVTPSIQTAPLGFKPRVTGPDVVDAFTDNVLQVCAHLVKIEKTTGKLLTLGLEPEPRCHLETTDETIAYFQQHLYTGKAAARLSKLANIPMDTAIAALRRHLGVTFDIGHQAVGFEDIPRVAAEAGRRGDPDREAPGSGVDVHRRSHRREGRGAQALCQDGLSLADGRVPRGSPRALHEPRRRVRRLGQGQDAAAVAVALPRAGLPRRTSAR